VTIDLSAAFIKAVQGERTTGSHLGGFPYADQLSVGRSRAIGRHLFGGRATISESEDLRRSFCDDGLRTARA